MGSQACAPAGVFTAVFAISMTCADVAALTFPTLKNTTCETSYDGTSGFPGQSWGVCALD